MSPATRRNLRLMGAFNFCNDFRVYAPIMAVYFAQVTGSLALGTLLFSIAKIASSTLEVPTGIFSDFIGRRLTVALGQIASAASIACYALGNDFTLLAVGSVLEGLAFALFSGNNEALLYDTLKADGALDVYPDWQGRLSSLFQLALAVSAVVALVALNALPLRAMFFLSLAPALLGIVFAVMIDEPRRSDSIPANIYAHLREAFAGFVRDVRLRDLSLAAMLGYALGEAKHMFHPVFFALLWPAWALGAAGALVHGAGALGFRIAGPVIRRFGELRVLLAANIGSILAGAGAVLILTPISPAIIGLASILFGPAMISQGSLMQRAFSDAQRATMGSLNSLGGNLLFAVAVFGIGALADRIGPRYALLTAELLTISVTLLYWRLYGHNENQAA